MQVLYQVKSAGYCVLDAVGAGDGIRTRDIQLGRLTLCQLSYSRTGAVWSGRLDSNQRPSAPKADALPDCATPRRRAAQVQKYHGGAGMVKGD